MKLWDTTTGQEQGTFKCSARDEMGVAFSSDGKLLASIGPLGVDLYDVSTGKQLRTVQGHLDRVLAVAFSPDGQRLASGSADRTVKLWDAATDHELRTLDGHDAKTSITVTFSPDGKRLASANHGDAVKLWDMTTGQLLSDLHGGFLPLAFSPNGHRLASAGMDQTVKLWDTTTGQEVGTLKGHIGGISGVAFSPDGQWVATANDQAITLWDSTTTQELRTLRTGAVITVVADAASVGSDAGSIRHEATLVDAPVLKGHDGVKSVTFSPDGARLASAGHDQMVKLWEVTTGQQIRTLSGHTDGIMSVSFSPDGQWLASAGQDQTVKLWDVSTGQELRTLKGHAGWILNVAFSSDGQRLVTASVDQTVKLWNVATGQELLTLMPKTDGLGDVALSPDGKMLAAGGAGTIFVWDARPATPDLSVEREASGVVRFLLEKNLQKEEIISSIQSNPTITDTVREKAFFLLEPSWMGRVRQRASRLATSLFNRLLFQSKVLDAIRQDTMIDEEVRTEALSQAAGMREDAGRLNEASWKIVQRADADKSAYSTALQYAEAASRLEPNSGFILNTLGMAQYRVGQYSEAVQAVAKLRKLGTATAGQLYDAACVYSLCAAGIKPEKETDKLTAEQSATRQQHIADALATLREAIGAGWKDFDHIQKDPDLAPLRDLPEFKSLLPPPASGDSKLQL